MEQYYRQPGYYPGFVCAGGDCPESCCDHWRVCWSKPEVDAVRETAESAGLREKTGRCFVPCAAEKIGRSDIFGIELGDDDRCPFHNKETGLCDIQAELGAEKLGLICREYPRRFRRLNGDTVLRWCSTSCPEVLRTLIEDAGTMKLQKIPADDIHRLEMRRIVPCDDPGDDEAPLYVPYRSLIIECFLEIFGCDTDFSTSMLTGMMTAHSIDVTDSRDSIPDVVSMLGEVLVPEAVIAASDGIDGDIVLKANNAKTLLSGMRIPITTDISVLSEGKDAGAEKYLSGRKAFDKAVDGADKVLNNISANVFLDTVGNAEFKEHGLYEAFAYFAVCMETIEYIACAAGYQGGDIADNFIRSVSLFARRISHNRTEEEQIYEYLRKCGVSGTAYMTALIKAPGK